MAWTNKTKIAAPSSTLKTKVAQQGDSLEIQTPDGHQILVGESEDQVLVYQDGFNNWSLKTKIT